MIVRFIGDVHQIYTNYNRLTNCGYRTIQVGDFGQGFEPQETYVDPADNKVKLRPGPSPIMMGDMDQFIRGNHDNPAICKAHPHWIKDGHIEDNMMFIGGAESIDKKDRIERMKAGGEAEWWEDEQLSRDELNDLVDIALQEKPAVMVTHDCPSFLLDKVFYGSKPPSITSQALNVIWKLAPPKLWVFGHYHRSVAKKFNDTLFICCDIDEAVDIDISKLIAK